MPRGQPQQDGRQHRQIGLAQHDPKDRRKEAHQDDVEWKHVQIDRLELEHQTLAQRLGCLIDKSCDIEFVDDLGIAEPQRQIADRGDIDDEQNNVGDVELPDPLGQTRGADDKAAFQHHSRIDEGGGVTRNEYEQVGRIAEAVVPCRDPVHDIVRNMVQKNCPVGDPAKQIEPEVASFFRQGGVDFHESRFDVMRPLRIGHRAGHRPCNPARLSPGDIMNIPDSEDVTSKAGESAIQIRDEKFHLYPGCSDPPIHSSKGF